MTDPLVLGVSALYHNAAAALAAGDDIVCAAEEERFSRVKNDARFPRAAIEFCLDQARRRGPLAAAAFYESPVKAADRVLANAVQAAPDGALEWPQVVRSLASKASAVSGLMRDAVGDGVPLYYLDHHLSHAASAYYPAPFDEAAVLVMDGVGEWATTSIAHGCGDDLRIVRELTYPHSIGLFYAAFTYFCGFKVNTGEYKLMGLAPYGRPGYVDLIKQHLIDIRDDGSFRLNMTYFGFANSDEATNAAFGALFGLERRPPGGALSLAHMDLAASAQAVVNEVAVKLAAEAGRLTGSRRLCMAGGVALNCVANRDIALSGRFDDIWIQPAAGDAGGALGAALYTARQLAGTPRPAAAARMTGRRDGQKGSMLGPHFPAATVRRVLETANCRYSEVEDLDARAAAIAGHLADGRIVGLFEGGMEFGPRSLGARSILADARRADAQSTINLKIKFRESWRPFAPIVLAEDAPLYFEPPLGNPYMLMIARVRQELTRPVDWEGFRAAGGDMMAMINQVRSTIPAVTHVDHTARVQLVYADVHPFLHRVLTAFKKLTGVSVLVNTSFNIRGEPIVCTPMDALTCFLNTHIDLLALESCLVDKATLGFTPTPRCEGYDDDV